nr:EOG090X0I48 [Eulimnadia texana]
MTESLPPITSNLKIATGAVVCSECELLGDITIGPKTVIHPRSRILALSGPIIIGENNIIEEQVTIINQHESGQPIVVGNNNVFEVDCHVESQKIGDNNVIESKAYIGKHTILSSACVIGAKCRVEVSETLPEGTLFSGLGLNTKRRTHCERNPAPVAQGEFLSKVLPNYHHCIEALKRVSVTAIKKPAH